MQSNIQSVLIDMLHACKKALSMCDGYDLKRFLSDEKTQWAVYSQIIILGEAANRVSREDQIRLNTIPWKLIVGMRNRLIHNYDDIVWERVWATLQNDLPKLIKSLETSATSST